MNLQKWVIENRDKIDEVISSHTIDDEEREDWVMNDEYLYNQAKEDGVDV